MNIKYFLSVGFLALGMVSANFANATEEVQQNEQASEVQQVLAHFGGDIFAFLEYYAEVNSSGKENTSPINGR